MPLWTAALVGWGSGCTAPPPSDVPLTVRVSVQDGGKLQVDGRPCSLDRLPARLRARGAEADTPITLRVSDTLDAAAMASIHRVLIQSGFRRVVFSRDRHITATSE